MVKKAIVVLLGALALGGCAALNNPICLFNCGDKYENCNVTDNGN